MNPSPGNVKDGLTTDAIKSAGAARKGGTSPVVDVLDFPGWVTKDGLSLLCTAEMMWNPPLHLQGRTESDSFLHWARHTDREPHRSSQNFKQFQDCGAFKEYIDFDTGTIIGAKKQ